MAAITKERRKSIAIKLSCYDYRVSQDKFGLSRPVLYEIVRKLPEPTIHIRNVKLLGFKHIIIGIRSRDLWNKLINAIKVEELSGIPYPRLVSVLGFFLGKIVHVAYVVHESLFPKVFKEITEWIYNLEKKGEKIEYFFSGESLPIHNCAGELGFEKRIIENVKNNLDTMLKQKPYRSRMPLVDYIITAALDLFPKLTPKQLGHLIYAAMARLERELDKWTVSFIRYKFINRHYRALSREGIIGRIWVPREVLGECYEHIAFIASGDCLEDVYVAAAATLSAANIVASREYVMASLNVPPDFRRDVLNRIGGCVLRPLISYRARVFPLPFELYDPVRRVWRTEPVGYDLHSLLRKFRLVDSKEEG